MGSAGITTLTKFHESELWLAIVSNATYTLTYYLKFFYNNTENCFDGLTTKVHFADRLLNI